ncbi:MAG: ADP-forming succinate--CoA ligase subunit beta [Parabacteroides sp.]|uniref:Succinate--CoA ligase [ADP-forming] subunit beta n=2 Tax=root TaxID=1 RepID=A0A1T5BJQ3_9BACT|nr:ADP-forming succinate--CoA ligase subunit beta [Parabacteroides chartae]MDD3507472.1 ADP-forming succinate--CoA ligase subunit beta [Parabacteroides sp.]MDT3368515.1 ADP-forming succinate--CoA ligase subunit beta [Bacteroidota bacterium]MEA4808875.1 ADP-forming succinate--CoA ligase subunit beta [Macellibacteroides fermentans]SKB47395.1 succinyl-CoA synthetase beta subunit [Parabacteroides chartae]HML71972.1 ADP-forming succinate--CoA ligase subunit beta [Macellibacteroides fermentans]
MKIHEYQAKELFAAYDIPVKKQILCHTADEAVDAYSRLNVPLVVLKAQVLTGGRGKAGGIKLADSPEKVKANAEAILGIKIKDIPVDRILVTEAADIKKEYYMSIVVDRNTKSALLMLSSDGGIDIEEVAHSTPERIYKFQIDPLLGTPDFFTRKVAFSLFTDIKLINQLSHIIKSLYKLMLETDASLAEINPLVLTPDDTLVAVDAKMTFDDNALYRQPQIATLFEPTVEEKKEKEAKAKGFSYVHLGGEIGCMVNGAGLAMATMDLIKRYRGKPANFLDIGGSSNSEKVVHAMKLLLQDSDVKVVLINIFGGITRCDDVANGLLKAFEQIDTDIPVVVRLTGTNEELGRALLKDSKLYVANTMSEATRMAVNLALKTY